MVSGSVGPCAQFDTINTTTAMTAARMRTIRLLTGASYVFSNNLYRSLLASRHSAVFTLSQPDAVPGR